MTEQLKKLIESYAAAIYKAASIYGFNSTTTQAKVAEAAQTIYDLGVSDGKAVMQTTITALEEEVTKLTEEVAQLTAEKEKSFDEGYQQGHGDALKSLDIAEESEEVAEEKAEEVVKLPLIITADESEFSATSVEDYNAGNTKGLKGVVIC